MQDSSSTRRFEAAPTARIGDLEVPVAKGFRARLLGLSGLDLDEAGAGLLIPRCSSVHTFGMRFPLDVHFLDSRGAVLRVRRLLPPRRLASHRAAAAVLELPAAGLFDQLEPAPSSNRSQRGAELSGESSWPPQLGGPGAA